MPQNGNRSAPNRSRQRSNDQNVKEIEKIALLLAKTDDPKKYDEYCDKIRSYVNDQLRRVTSTQTRNIFNRVRKVQDVMGVKKLRPILAYTGARNSITYFTNLLDNIIRDIKNEQDLESFKEFLKIIVAYKKLLESKKS